MEQVRNHCLLPSLPAVRPDHLRLRHRTSGHSHHDVGSCSTGSTSETIQINPVLQRHAAEAVSLLRAARFEPWVLNGRRTPVIVPMSVGFAPPERYGPERPLPALFDRDALSISLERRGCEGRCPAYSIDLSPNGSITYVGRAYVKIFGRHTARVPRASVTKLLNAFERARFTSALPEYSGAFDGGWTAIRLSGHGQTLQVVDESGSGVGLPSLVAGLEQQIDEAANTRRWIRGTADTLKSLQAEQWNFSQATDDNVHTFDQAILDSDVALTQAYLDSRIPVLYASAKQDDVVSPLIAAARSGNTALTEKMLAKAPQPIPPAVLFQELLSAFRSGSIPMIDLWLKEGADPHAHPVASSAKHSSDGENMSILGSAIQSGSSDAVRRALQLGFSPKARIDGRPALVYALVEVAPANINTSVIRLLLEAGADAKAYDRIWGNPLMQASSAEILTLLLAAGADPNFKDASGYTPLMMHANDLEAVHLLLAAGADPTKKTKDGRTVLNAASEMASSPQCFQELRSALQKRGVNPDKFRRARAK